MPRKYKLTLNWPMIGAVTGIIIPVGIYVDSLSRAAITRPDVPAVTQIEAQNVRNADENKTSKSIEVSGANLEQVRTAEALPASYGTLRVVDASVIQICGYDFTVDVEKLLNEPSGLVSFRYVNEDLPPIKMTKSEFVTINNKCGLELELIDRLYDFFAIIHVSEL